MRQIFNIRPPNPASHHAPTAGGSHPRLRHSVSAAFPPVAAIVSCGAGNGYHHPAGATMARLAALGTQIYRTDELGNILLAIRDGRYTLTYA